MSQGNVEITRRYWETLQDWEEIPEWIPRFWESDGDYYPVRAFPEAKPCHGHQEIITFLMEFRDAWDGYVFEVKDATALAMIASSSKSAQRLRDARAARSSRVTSTTAAGCDMDVSSGSRIT